MATITRADAVTVAEKTADAYSVDRYRSWPAVAEALMRRGYDARETEAILRSKWTRWAADASNDSRYGRATSSDLIRFMSNMHPDRDVERREVRQLVRETF